MKPKLPLDQLGKAVGVLALIYFTYCLLALLPRDSSACRVRNRCKITGRPRGYTRRVGISRNMLRYLAHEGVLPGLSKSSW